MSMESYKTPEGFELPHQLLFPDARKFEEILTVDGVWDYATMNHRNGVAPPGRPEDIKAPEGSREKHGAFSGSIDRTVGRFCSTRLWDQPNMVVTPTQQVLDAIFTFDGPFVFFDRVGFEAIYHESNDRVLIVASASGILATRWLAYVDPEVTP